MNNVFRAKFPSWDMVLALSPRELAYEIVLCMNEKSAQSHHAKINWTVNGIAEGIASAYANRPENRLVIMEGIEMTFATGLLTESGTTGNPYVFLTRAGQAIKTGVDARTHHTRTLEAASILDERIRDAIWTPYLKGDYDIAIAYAFKRVEVEMRDKGSFSKNDFSERLIKKFFTKYRLANGDDGPKANTSTLEEQLFIGAFGLYRNSASHLDETVDDPQRAMEVLLMANHLLHLVRGTVPRTAANS